MNAITKAAPTPYTLDELFAVCIARQIVDGEIVAQGIATPLVNAGYILAKCTHAPDLRFASAIGQGICETWGPLGIARAEDFWLGHSLMNVGFVTGALDVLPRLHPKEFFRPAQVDPAGNFNNIALGKDYRHPRMRLPGSGGIPDVSVVSDRMYLYVTRHSKLTFVPQCDFVSGLGHSPARTAGSGPRYLLSDLGQFDWAEGQMRLTHVHPGVTVDQIRAKTGFPLLEATPIQVTEPPTAEEVRLLRDAIDPLDTRKLELLSGAARRDLLVAILGKEGAL
jgi:acyl CoA:acetate/3-ketoacid CoA transferase beta subunit